MPPKKGHVALKRKGQSNNTMQRAAKAATASASEQNICTVGVGVVGVGVVGGVGGEAVASRYGISRASALSM